MKRAVITTSVIFILGVVLIAVLGVGYNYGKAAGINSIQRSCDNPDEQKTMINGHAYLCGDFDAVQNAIRQIQRQRGA